MWEIHWKENWQIWGQKDKVDETVLITKQRTGTTAKNTTDLPHTFLFYNKQIIEQQWENKRYTRDKQKIKISLIWQKIDYRFCKELKKVNTRLLLWAPRIGLNSAGIILLFNRNNVFWYYMLQWGWIQLTVMLWISENRRDEFNAFILRK